MRALSAVITLALLFFVLPGCDKKIELDPAKTVAFDPQRDGEPKTGGGPAAKTPGKTKKGGGVMAPPVEEGK